MSVVRVDETRSASSSARGERAAQGLRVRAVAQPLLQLGPQPRQRRAQVVGHVVERSGQARDQGLDAVQHPVEQAGQVVEGVSVAAHRHPDGDLPRAHDPPEHRVEPPQRSEGRAGDEDAPHHGEEEARDEEQGGGGTEAPEDVGADLRALADLEERAVPEADRSHLEGGAGPGQERPARLRLRAGRDQAPEVEADPGRRHAREESLRPRPQHSHEEALVPARHAVRGHRLPHRVEAAAPVLLDVLLQRGENEVPVPLREGGGEEGVGQEDERQAARHEEPRVP